MLLEREAVPIGEAVRRVMAIQAQEPASPYVALWNRVADFDPADLDTAFRDRDVVKATLMRATLHAVHRTDYPIMRGAMGGRLRARLNDKRFVDTGLTAAEFDDLMLLVTAFATEPRTSQDIEDMLEEHLGEPPDKGIWWAIRNVGAIQHAPTDATWSFGQRNAFTAVPDDPEPTSDVLASAIHRYLEAFGPASARDFGQFTLQTQAAIKPALTAMDDRLLRHEGPNGEVLFDVEAGEIPDEATSVPPRLMAMWDSTLLAYADRSRVIPEEFRKTVIRNNGDVLPTLLVDGFVAGVWRATPEGIEATAFRRLSDDEWKGLVSGAYSLAELVDRDPLVYSRYNRWWQSIDGAETRLLT